MRSIRLEYQPKHDWYAVGFYRMGKFITIKYYTSTFEMTEPIEAWCKEGTLTDNEVIRL
jgi:hypothetical protein